MKGGERRAPKKRRVKPTEKRRKVRVRRPPGVAAPKREKTRRERLAPKRPVVQPTAMMTGPRYEAGPQMGRARGESWLERSARLAREYITPARPTGGVGAGPDVGRVPFWWERLEATPFGKAVIDPVSERIAQRMEDVRAPIEEPQLPGALSSWLASTGASDSARRMKEGGYVARMMGPVGTGPLEAAGTVWHDIKQLPVIGQVARATQAAGGIALEMFTLPSVATEAALGRAMWETKPDARFAEIYGLPYTGQSYGDSLKSMHPEVSDKLLNQYLMEVSMMAWSGTEAGIAGFHRMAAGEEPETVRNGKVEARDSVRAALLANYTGMNAEGDWEITEESLPVFEEALGADGAAYWNYAMEQGRDPLEVANEMVQKGVPGEAKIGRELVGQLLYDPLNLIGIGGKARRTNRWYTQVVDDAVRLERTPVDEVFAATQKGRNAIARIFEKTPPSKQSAILGEMGDMLRLVFSGVHEDDQIRALKAMMDLAGEPDDVAKAMAAMDDLGWGRQILSADDAKVFGLQVGDTFSPLESSSGKRVSYLLRQMFTDANGVYDPSDLGRILSEAPTGQERVAALVGRMVDAADAAYPTKKASEVMRYNNAVRGHYAKYHHMGFSPGYMVRALAQDIGQGAIDGVLGIFDSKKSMTTLFDDVGGLTSAAVRGLGGGPGGEFRAAGVVAGVAEETTRWQKIKAAVKQGPMIWLAGHNQEKIGLRAVHTGIKNTFAKFWRVGQIIPEDDVMKFYSAVGDDAGRVFMSDVLRARNPQQIDAARDAVRAGEGYRELWRTLSPEHIERLSEIGSADEVVEVVAKARTPEALEAGFEALKRAAWARADDLDDAGDLFSKGSYIDDVLAGSDVPMGELPRGIEGQAAWEEGQRRLKMWGRRVKNSQNRAAYYAAQTPGAGDEFIDAYRTAQESHQQTQGIVFAKLEETRGIVRATQGTRAKSRVWDGYFSFRTEMWRQFFEGSASKFDDLADVAKGAVGDIGGALPATLDDELAKIASVLDDGHAPTGADIARSAAPEVEGILDAVKADVLGRWGQVGGKLDSTQLKALDDITDLLKQRNNTVRTMAVKMGEIVRDFTYHNYSDRRNFDAALGVIYMYPFWYTRTYATWAQRIMDQPHLMAAYYKAEEAIRQSNAGLPDWWKDQVKVPGISDIVGEDVYVNFRALIDPLNGLMDDFESPERARVQLAGMPIGKWVEKAGGAGPTTNVIIQWAMAGIAYSQGDDEAARAWMGYMGGPTRVIPPLTALVREHVPGAEEVIPPGGMGVEPWHWDKTANGWRYGGSIYDRARTSKAVAELWRSDQMSLMDAELAAYATSGPMWDEALQQQMMGQVMPTVTSLMLGPGAKPRKAYEMELTQMWDARNSLRLSREDMTPEDYANAWRGLRQRWPDFNIIMMARSNDEERDEALTWTVLNRLPPGWQKERIFDDFHIETLVHQFYDDRGDMSGWSDDDRRALMAAIIKMAGDPDLMPTPEKQVERREVRELDAEMKAQAQELFGEHVFDRERQYYNLRDAGASREYLKNYLAQHPEVEEMWDWRDQYRREDPVLKEYYVEPPPSPEEIEEERRAHMQEEIAYRWPEVDIYDLQGGYFDIPEDDKAARRRYLRDHPEVKEYWGLLGAIGLREQVEPHLQFVFDAYEEAERRWPGIADTQDEYFRIKEAEGKEAAKAYLKEHPELKSYWDLMRTVKGEEEEEYAGGRAYGGRAYGGRRYGGRRYGGGGRPMTWDSLIGGMGDLGVLANTALSNYFGFRRELPDEIKSRLQKMWADNKMGYGTFEEFLNEYVKTLWAAWLRRTGFAPMEPRFPFERQSGYSPRSRRQRARF